MWDLHICSIPDEHSDSNGIVDKDSGHYDSKGKYDSNGNYDSNGSYDEGVTMKMTRMTMMMVQWQLEDDNNEATINNQPKNVNSSTWWQKGKWTPLMPTTTTAHAYEMTAVTTATTTTTTPR